MADMKAPMADLLTPKDFEHLAVEAGLSMSQISRRAKVAHSIFVRWKGGSTLTVRSYQKLLDAVQAAVAEKKERV